MLSRRDEYLPLFEDHPPVADNVFGLNGLQVRDNNDVSVFARRDAANILVEGEVLGDVDGGHLHRQNGVEAQVDGLLHHELHIAVADQLVGAHPIGGYGQAVERKTAVLYRGDGLKLPSHLTLPDRHEKPQLKSFQDLFGVGRLVAGADARGHVGLQLLTVSAGAVPVHLPAQFYRFGDEVEQSLVAPHHVPPVRLAQTDDLFIAEKAAQLFDANTVLFGYRADGDHGRGGDQDFYGLAARRVQEVDNPFVAQGGGDGAGLGDDGGGTPLDGEAQYLVYGVGHIDVGVAVDKAGDERLARGIDDLSL